MVSVSVCESGYEWRSALASSAPPSEWRLYPRYTEIIEQGALAQLQAAGARTIQRRGRAVARQIVPELRDLAERLEWLIFDEFYRPNEDRASRLRTALFSAAELNDIATMPRTDRFGWAQNLVREFAGEFGMLTATPQTAREWLKQLVEFREVDTLCAAIKRRRWEDIERYMIQIGPHWHYYSYELNEIICSEGDYWILEDGSRREWWSVAGRPEQRAKIAFSKIMTKKLNGAFSARIDRLLPEEGFLAPNNLLSAAYFVLWRSIASDDHDQDRDCEKCGYPLTAERSRDPRARFCNDACKQAAFRARERNRKDSRGQPS